MGKLFPDINERFGSWCCMTYDCYKKNIDDEKILDQLLTNENQKIINNMNNGY